MVQTRSQVDIPWQEMLAQPVVMWTADSVQCIAVHHSDARSYEIQIVEFGRLIERRWFDRAQEAMAFAVDQGARFGSPDVGLVP